MPDVRPGGEFEPSIAHSTKSTATALRRALPGVALDRLAPQLPYPSLKPAAKIARCSADNTSPAAASLASPCPAATVSCLPSRLMHPARKSTK